MRNRNLYNRSAGLKSYCDNYTVRGTAHQIRQKWEELGEAAEKAGDRVTSQRFRQQAEHYLKLANGCS